MNPRDEKAFSKKTWALLVLTILGILVIAFKGTKSNPNAHERVEANESLDQSQTDLRTEAVTETVARETSDSDNPQLERSPVSNVNSTNPGLVQGAMHSTTNDQAQINALQEEIRNCKATVLELEEALSKATSKKTEEEDPSSAYAGPGYWINPDGQRPTLTKIEITGELRYINPVLNIRVWGKCFPADCEWPTVSLKFLDYGSPAKKYKRAFAIWDFDHATEYLVLTFKKHGIEVEQISIHKTSVSKWNRTVYPMNRVW